MMIFNDDVTMYGDREVYTLYRPPEEKNAFPGKTVLLDKNTGDILVVPDNLSADASASVYYTGQYSLMKGIRQNDGRYIVSEDAQVKKAINACDNGVLIIKDFYQGYLIKKGNIEDATTGMDGKGNWDDSIASTNEILANINQVKGTNIVRQNTFGVSMGDNPAVRAWVENENRGILCIAGGANIHVNTSPPISQEEYANLVGETAFVFESKGAENENNYRYINKLADNGINTFLFETSNNPGVSAHGDAYTRAFGQDIFEAMNGDREQLKELFEHNQYHPKKRIIDENGKKVWVKVEEFNELYSEVFLNKLGDKEVKERFRALDTETFYKYLDADPQITDPSILTGRSDSQFNDYIKVKTVGGNAVDDKVLFNYFDIVDATDGVVNSLNRTRLNDGIKYPTYNTNTTGFPASLNLFSSELFSTTGTLLGLVADDTKNVETIINAFLEKDNDFTRAIGELDDSYGKNRFETPVSVADSQSLKLNESGDVFKVGLLKGKAGKISMSDINSIFSGNKVIGPIGDGLRAEYEDANRLKNSLIQLMELPNSVVEGDAWEKEMLRMERLVNCCDCRMRAAQTLEEAYGEALRLVKDYIGDDTYLDDGEIPQYQAELAAAKAVPPWRGTGMYNEYGDEIMEPNEPEYSEAQALIPVLEAKIEKLEGLAGVINRANDILLAAADSVRSDYTAAVNSVPQFRLGVN